MLSTSAAHRQTYMHGDNLYQLELSKHMHTGSLSQFDLGSCKVLVTVW